jgi:DUF4097 and DUF4098 domain-containing protein YvlB
MRKSKIVPGALPALLTLALAAGPARAGHETLHEQSQRVIEAAGLTGLEVNNPRGATEVRTSTDGKLHLSALKTVHASSASDARTLSVNTRVETQSSGGRYVVKVSYPQRHVVEVGFWDLFREGGFTMPETEVKLTLEVPSGLAVHLTSASGDLTTEDLGGRESLETISGDIHIRGAGGETTASTTSGDIEAEFDGKARLRTVSGDVTIEHSGQPLDAHTTSGDLVIRDAADALTLGSVSGEISVQRAPRGLVAISTSGNITAHAVDGPCELGTSSGDVDVSFGKRLERAQVSSGSGDLKARLANGLGATLDMRTSNGSIDVSAALAVQNVTRRSVSGRVGDGAIPISLRSSSGDIQILSGGE